MLLVSLLSACSEQNPLPEKIEGLWELHEIETTDKGTVNGRQNLLAAYPGCSWGRSTWTFGADHLQAGIVLLCDATPPSPPPVEGAQRQTEAHRDFYGCEVTVQVPASWDPEAGLWHVDDTVTARSKTRALDVDAIAKPTECQLTIPAGDYGVTRILHKPWRWEMRTPDLPPTQGGLYRLKLPDSERPDFVAALKSPTTTAEPSTVGTP